MSLTKTAVPNLSRFYEEDLSVLEALVSNLVDQEKPVPKAIEEILEERLQWDEMGQCNHCGSFLKSENNGYDVETEGGASMWETYCPKGC